MPRKCMCGGRLVPQYQGRNIQYARFICDKCGIKLRQRKRQPKTKELA